MTRGAHWSTVEGLSVVVPMLIAGLGAAAEAVIWFLTHSLFDLLLGLTIILTGLIVDTVVANRVTANRLLDEVKLALGQQPHYLESRAQLNRLLTHLISSTPKGEVYCFLRRPILITGEWPYDTSVKGEFEEAVLAALTRLVDDAAHGKRSFVLVYDAKAMKDEVANNAGSEFHFVDGSRQAWVKAAASRMRGLRDQTAKERSGSLFKMMAARTSIPVGTLVIGARFVVWLIDPTSQGDRLGAFSAEHTQISAVLLRVLEKTVVSDPATWESGDDARKLLVDLFPDGAS